MARRPLRALAGVSAGIAAILCLRPARAQYLPLPPAVLTGMHGGGGGAVARAPHGVFLGADAGWAAMLASGKDPMIGAFSFGVRGGYQWRSGLAAELRFDDLGVAPPRGGGSLLFASGGVRYGFPLVVMPFAEVLVGAGFNGSHASPGAGLGAGLSLPVLRHLAIDLTGRDWIAHLDGAVRHVLTVELGLTIGFGGR